MGLDAHVNRAGVHEDTAEIADRICDKRIGNMTLVAQLREQVQRLPASKRAFPILLEKVLYSGIHAGDEIPTEAVADLESELDQVEQHHLSAQVARFIKDMRELCSASRETSNPIVF